MSVLLLTVRAGFDRLPSMGVSTYPRIYQTILEEHLSKYRQMVFLSGPRQVGKTTVARSASTEYLNWDDASVKRMVMSGPAAVATHTADLMS